MRAEIVVPLALALLLGGAFVVNEWSYGGLSEALGWGHHHLLDHPCRADAHAHGDGEAADDVGAMHRDGGCHDEDHETKVPGRG